MNFIDAQNFNSQPDDAVEKCVPLSVAIFFNCGSKKTLELTDYSLSKQE